MLSIPQSLFSGTSKGILLIGETLNEPGAKGEVRLGEGVERAGFFYYNPNKKKS